MMIGESTKPDQVACQASMAGDRERSRDDLGARRHAGRDRANRVQRGNGAESVYESATITSTSRINGHSSSEYQ